MLETIKKPWFFILTGVLMTVLSAVVTNYFIVKNNAVIEKTLLKISRLEKRIDQTWHASGDLERLEETGTILLLMTDLAKGNVARNHAIKASTRYLEKVIRTGAVDPNTTKKIRSEIASGNIARVLDILFTIIDLHKVETISGINDMYIEKAALERQKIGMEERNTILKNIALFLQIMGLILVLSSGLTRSNNKNPISGYLS